MHPILERLLQLDFYICVASTDWINSYPEWATLDQLWYECDRGDWLYYFLGCIGYRNSLLVDHLTWLTHINSTHSYATTKTLKALSKLRKMEMSFAADTIRYKVPFDIVETHLERAFREHRSS